MHSGILHPVTWRAAVNVAGLKICEYKRFFSTAVSRLLIPRIRLILDVKVAWIMQNGATPEFNPVIINWHDEQRSLTNDKVYWARKFRNCLFSQKACAKKIDSVTCQRATLRILHSGITNQAVSEPIDSMISLSCKDFFVAANGE